MQKMDDRALYGLAMQQMDDLARKGSGDGKSKQVLDAGHAAIDAALLAVGADVPWPVSRIIADYRGWCTLPFTSSRSKVHACSCFVPDLFLRLFCALFLRLLLLCACIVAASQATGGRIAAGCGHRL